MVSNNLISRTEEYYDELIHLHNDKLILSLKKSISELLDTYPQEEKGDLKYIIISYLRTGVLNKTPVYRIDCYNHKKHRDLIEHSTFWDISFLTDLVYQQFPVTEDMQPVQIAKLEKLCIKDFETVHFILSNKMTEICSSAVRMFQGKSRLWVRIYWGEYLGKTKYICTLEGTN